MANSWKLRVDASKEDVQAALIAHEQAWDWDQEIVLSGCEIAEDRPEEWVLEAWFPCKPNAADKRAVAALFSGDAPKITAEEIEAADWLKLSQEGVDPITAGRFYVRTPNHRVPADKSLVDFVIPASQAFGTGQHETTAGCLAMLDLMKRQGIVIRNCADIGTGTGLLVFGALRLWSNAHATASDIDKVCAQVVADNAATNRVTMGTKRGAVAMTIAAGMEDALLQSRGPYDLLIANILAGPLIELAYDFGEAVQPSGHLLLAGLLTEQEAAVRSVYRAAGFRLARRLVNGDWSILWLRKRRG